MYKKLWIPITLIPTGLLLYWVGGGNFERNLALAVVLFISIWLSAFIIVMLDDKR
jgi:hypothetical protein